MVASVEDCINQALRRIGNKTPIGWIYEGSEPSRVAIEVYGQCRDNLLSGTDWDFARQDAVLALLKTAPPGGYGYGNPWTTQYPLLPWVYEYAYPANCLTMRAVRCTPMLMPVYSPRPNNWILGDDPSVTPSKVVLTNLAGAVGIYTAQITDPTQYEPEFVEALVEALARRLGEGLGANLDAIKTQEQIAEADDAKAGSDQG